MNNKIDPKLVALANLIANTRDVSVFQADRNQRRAKSNFWTHFGSANSGVPLQEDLATALRFGADKRISQWWDLPGFQDWFLNRDEFRQRLEFLSHLSLDVLEEIVTSKQSSNMDKLQALKMILAAQPKEVSEAEVADAVIAKMTKQQLQEYISRNIKLLPPTDKQ